MAGHQTLGVEFRPAGRDERREAIQTEAAIAIGAKDAAAFNAADHDVVQRTGRIETRTVRHAVVGMLTRPPCRCRRRRYAMAAVSDGRKSAHSAQRPLAATMKGRTVAVVLAPDVASVFTSSESVNSLLRSVIPLTLRVPQGERKTLSHKDFPAHAEALEA